MADPAVTTSQFRAYLGAATTALRARDWEQCAIELGSAEMILQGLEKSMASSGESYQLREELKGAWAALEKTKTNVSQSSSAKRFAYARTTFGR